MALDEVEILVPEGDEAPPALATARLERTALSLHSSGDLESWAMWESVCERAPLRSSENL